MIVSKEKKMPKMFPEDTANSKLLNLLLIFKLFNFSFKKMSFAIVTTTTKQGKIPRKKHAEST